MRSNATFLAPAMIREHQLEIWKLSMEYDDDANKSRITSEIRASVCVCVCVGE